MSEDKVSYVIFLLTSMLCELKHINLIQTMSAINHRKTNIQTMSAIKTYDV